MAKTLHTDSVQQRGADEEGAATTLLELHEVCHHSRRSFLVPPTLRLGGPGLHINKGYRGLLVICQYADKHPWILINHQ